MAKKRISNSDLIWAFHEKLRKYDDFSQYGISIGILHNGNGSWGVITERKLTKRKPDLAKRLSSIEKQLQKQYSLAAD